MGSSVVLTDDDDNALKRRIMHHSCFYLNSPLYCLMSLGSNIERDSVCKEVSCPRHGGTHTCSGTTLKEREPDGNSK